MKCDFQDPQINFYGHTATPVVYALQSLPQHKGRVETQTVKIRYPTIGKAGVCTPVGIHPRSILSF